MAAPHSREQFEALIVKESDTLCLAFRNLLKLSVMWWKMLKYKYRTDGLGFTVAYCELLNAVECPDPAVAFDGETPTPGDFKNLIPGQTSNLCEKLVRLAVGLSQGLHDWVAFEWNPTGTDFSDEYKALICGIDCGDELESDLNSFLNYTQFEKWDVIAGAVDLIGIEPYDPVPNGSGMYVDLYGTIDRGFDGAAGPPFPTPDAKGSMRSKDYIEFEIGKTYSFRIKIAAAWVIGVVGTTRIRIIKDDLTTLLDEEYTPPSSSSQFTALIYPFTAGADASARIQIEGLVGNVNIGPKIDEISLVNVTDSVTLFEDNFDRELYNTPFTEGVTSPDPDDAKAIVPGPAINLCLKAKKLFVDFPTHVYETMAFEFNAGGSGFGVDYKRAVCQCLLNTAPEEEETNGLIPNLLAYWKLDEASGDVIDIHGGHDLAEAGGVLPSVAGKLNDAREFDTVIAASGADEAWNVMDGRSFTFTGWVKLTDVATLQRIFIKGSTSGLDFSYGMYIVTSQLGAFIQQDPGPGGDNFMTPSPAMATGEWYFVVMRYDHTTFEFSVSFGQGGLLSHNAPSIAPGHPRDFGGDFALGGEVDTGVATVGLTAGGILDECALWDRFLSVEELDVLYGGGTPPAYETFTL